MSTAIFLVNPSVRCCSVAYDKAIDTRTGKELPKDVKSFKTLDANLKEGDLVMIPTDTRWGFSVGKIIGVDLDVNHDSHEEMRWIVGPVDTGLYTSILEQEKAMMAKVKEADDRARQAELAKKLREHSPDFSGIALIDMKPVESRSTYEPEPNNRGGAQS